MAKVEPMTESSFTDTICDETGDKSLLCMKANVQRKQSLFSRAFTKEEALDHRRYISIENSDVPASRVCIKSAIDKAIVEMKEELNSYSGTKK